MYIQLNSFPLTQKDVAVQVNGEMAAVLQSSRFSSDFKIQMLDKQESKLETTPEVSNTTSSLWLKCF